MDPTTLIGLLLSGTVSGVSAAAVSELVTRLTILFRRRPASEGVEITDLTPAGVVRQLEETAQNDPDFARLWKAWIADAQNAVPASSVTNSVVGDVQGTVIQANSIGDIRL